MKKGFLNVGDVKLLGVLSSLSSVLLLLMHIDTLCNTIGVILMLIAIICFCVSHNVSKRLYKQCIHNIIGDRNYRDANKRNTIDVANWYWQINKRNSRIEEEWGEIDW